MFFMANKGLMMLDNIKNLSKKASKFSLKKASKISLKQHQKQQKT